MHLLLRASLGPEIVLGRLVTSAHSWKPVKTQEWLAPRELVLPLTITIAAFWYDAGCQTGAMPTENTDYDTRLGTVDNVVDFFSWLEILTAYKQKKDFHN